MTQVGNSTEALQGPVHSRMKFRIADIKVNDRKRKANDITALAASIKQLGLLNPITIKPDGTLIAGLNRLEACKSLGWEGIEVNIRELDGLHAELAEIDENLIRNELHFLDRDDWMKRRKEIYEQGLTPPFFLAHLDVEYLNLADER